MVWKISQVNVSKDQSVILSGNSSTGQVVTNPGAVLGGNYILGFPGLGYIQMIDKGNSVPGPGDWSVQLTGSSTNWFYRGQGDAHVTVDASGNYTWSGGANAVTGKVASWA